ncbi:MAG TPA: class I SAM-dependent methyltransferase [Candidatus Saccharimonadales bacterium]|nr:class I SAM-dependent methyltransferase [Candidatus Saccharimonadales bacterium]
MKPEIVQKLRMLSKQSYDKIAAEFDATRKKYLWPEMIKLAAGIKAGARILDAGCGNGRLLEAFTDKQIKYLGIDNSQILLNLARANYPERDFQEIDLSMLNFAETQALTGQQFDFIFCIAVLQHIPSTTIRIQVLKNFKKLLAPGGQLIISNWNLWASAKRNLIFKQAFKKVIGLNKLDFGDLIFPWKNSAGEEVSERYYHAFNKRELRSLASQAGFKKIVVKKDTHNYWLILE